jgi:uncharacterized membrane protein
MIFSVAKVISVKTVCKGVDAELLVFYSRAFPALILVVPAFYSDVSVNNMFQFIGATITAAVLTIFASTMYIRSMQDGMIAVVSPIQGSVPVFMVVTTYLLYGEKPSDMALLLLLVITASVTLSIFLTSQSKTTGKGRFLPVLLSTAASGLYGVSTVVDRVAISATTNGAILYAASWNFLTLLFLSVYFTKNSAKILSQIRGNLWGIAIFVTASAVALVFQQMAVGASLDVENGVTYVKTIVMIHIGLSALLAMVFLKERVSKGLFVSNFIALASGIALVFVV